MARQPILTRDERVFGYELLFRDGMENYFRATDPEGAAQNTLDSSLLFGLDVLCDRHYAFINCTRELLLKDYVSLLPPKQTVLEILETVKPDTELIAACQKLREAGYLLALDDFAENDPRVVLAGTADILKVDLKASPPAECAALVRRYGSSHRMLAEKVETREEFQAMRDMGFTYFQGFFFQKPQVLVTHDIPANKVNYLRMLQAVARDELDLREIEALIKSEVSICYRLLRYLNSAIFAFGNEIHSVRHALSLLGEREIRRWVRLVATVGAGQAKSGELVRYALVRGRFCELLRHKVSHGGSDLFLMGMMSLMDAVLEMPLAAVLEKVHLEQAIKNVLLGKPSHLRTIYRLLLAQESGEWEAVAELARLQHMSSNDVEDAYWEAMRWAREVTAE